MIWIRYWPGVVADCLLQQARVAGAGVVIVTSDTALAARADKVLHLDGGQLYEAGPGETVTDHRDLPTAAAAICHIGRRVL